MSWFVKFWGTRGSCPAPGPQSRKYGGNTSCVEIHAESALLICDGGTGLRELGLDLMKRKKGEPIRGHFLFSHTHWDHIQGFPFFVPAYDPRNEFLVYGTSRGDKRTFDLLSGQMRSEYFPVEFSELRARIAPADLGDGHADVEGFSVRCVEVKHPGRSFAFSLEREGKKVVYATDNELDQVLTDPEQPSLDPNARRAFPEPLVEFARGAELLIGDGQYTDEEYPTHVGWGHSRATTLVDLAVAAECRQLAVFHHDPMQSDKDVDRKIELCRERATRHGSKVVVFGAREGLELRIG
jgi:phosphoribosyl 1,2-cyclic phosphodiesterase